MQQSVVLIGEWLVTPSINQISRQGRQLTLEPRLIDLLVYFAHHPDEVLSRDELIDNIWTRNVVTNHVVTQSISELRKSLKDAEENSPEYIITVPKRGYKLTAPVVWCIDGDVPQRPSTEPSLTEFASLAKPELTAKAETTGKVPKKARTRTSFWVWCLFLLALGSCVMLIALSTLNSRAPVTKTRLLLNPRDIDIHLVNGNSCNNWASQHSYAVGLGSLITTSLNTFSTFMVHDKTDYNVNEPSNSGKTMTIEFVNQRHYRAQQCFMSVKLIDNADGSVMLDKRYFITSDNQISIQNDLMGSLSRSLMQPWPKDMQTMLRQFQPSRSPSLAQFYEAHMLMMKGDINSLGKASALLDDVIKQAPDFTYASAEKVLVDALRHSQQSLDDKQLAALYAGIDRISQFPQIEQTSVFYQIKTIEKLSQGHVNDAYDEINSGIAREMSWMNYVLLGKVYEMKGENRLAADAYITAFNLRPGNNTLYWIENGLFQTSITRVVPYLDNFLSAD